MLVDKPQGLTSHDVVARIRRLAGTRKVGHAGTLDPMATGLLIVGTVSATRLLTHLVGVDKEYTATIRLGQTSTTDDAEGEITAVADAALLASLTEEALAAGIAALTGPIEQVPSSVSAIKVDGKRAYERVRAGEEVELKARPVTIRSFELLAVHRPPEAAAIDLEVRVACSSGTYIRALARDLGTSLGVGGHLTALRRSKVGPFSVADATPLDALLAGDVALDAVRLSPSAAAARLFARLELSSEQAVDLGHGKKVETVWSAQGPQPQYVGVVPAAHLGIRAAVAPDGRLVALVNAKQRQDGTLGLRVLTGFPPDEAPASAVATGEVPTGEPARDEPATGGISTDAASPDGVAAP